MSAAGLFAPREAADPYPRYRALRESDPVHWDDPLGAWVFTRYRDVERVLRDSRFGVQRLDPRKLKQGPISSLRRSMFLFRDPPDHGRLRALARATFHPRRLRCVRPRIEAICTELLGELAREPEAELVEGLAYTLPVRVISELLGLPHDCHLHLRALSDSLARHLVGIDAPKHELVAAETGLRELSSLLEDVIALRRARPRDDGISALVAAHERGAQSGRELLGTCLLLFLAGHETTASWIANGLGALLCDRRAWDRLRSAPQLGGAIGAAVEELLRFESPIQATRRFASAPVEVGGRRLARGDTVFAVLGSANRDPAAFDTPDRLVLERRPNRHLAFGSGAHACLGAPLARLEAQIAIAGFVRHFPSCEALPGGMQWKPSTNLRGLARLDVRLS